ncbi:lipopolysaccharide assembly protein LapB [Treponema sp. C6A8]|uniref:tetratricopeptide repeat protein n=1 Tax=Treponema sp. C6A8 TaxID=1410609 RepID=UPI0004867173|nr:hypothetical protein [Treponema sp. C6A8]
MKSGLYFKKLIILVTAVSYFAASPAFSAKKKKDKDKSAASTAYSGADNVKLPSARRTYFYKIENDVVYGVENGSPQSLRKAMQALHHANGEYAENERTLIEIATQIMQLVWPSQKITWDPVQAPADNLYLGAIDSARNGIFDSSTGKSDFLSIILPALVILSPSVTQDSYDLCEQACKEALAYNSSSVLATYLLGITCSKKADYQSAGEYLKKAWETSDFSKEIAIAYAKVLIHYADYSGAEKILASFAQTSDVNDIDVLRLNAYVSFAKKDLPMAEQYVARVLQQTPNNLEFVLFRAKILIEKNDYIHAVSLLDMYAKQNDTSIDYLVLRAKVQLEWSKNTSTATQTVERALQLYPDNTEALMMAARISAETDAPVAGKYADELCAKILAAEPENSLAMRYALSGLIQRENWQAAYEIASKLTSMPNPSADIIKNYVDVCIKLRRKSEAFDFAKKMQMQFPNDDEILQAYVLAYCENGNRELVLKYLNSLIDSSSSKMKSYLYYRRSFLQLTEDAVLADLRSSLISNPRNSDALFRLYEVYYGKNDYRKAQYYLRQVVAIKPNDSSIRRLNEALTQLIK